MSSITPFLSLTGSDNTAPKEMVPDVFPSFIKDPNFSDESLDVYQNSSAYTAINILSCY